MLALGVWIVPGAPVISAAAEQKPEVQRLFQSGNYEQVVEAARDGDPASTYLAAQALLKLNNMEEVAAQFARLKGNGPAWSLVGESGEALAANDAGRAVELARRATQTDGENPFAFYQLGLSASKGGDWGTATPAFNRALELKPDLAYAHYYAALAAQRQRQLPKAAEHFEAFLRLAPEAPERQAVQAIMRSLK
ncbi:MAG: tetratricopeptide repeat protein [Acidobacteriota bacterium]|nr:tetratricopeptide repeat protein [Acidobacteriota bacterium]